MRTHRYTALLSALMVFAVACGGKDDAPTPANARQIDLAPTPATQPALTDAPVPAAAPAKAPAKAPVRAQPKAPPKKAEPEPAPAPRPQPPQPQPATAPAPAAPAAPTSGSVAAGTAFTAKPSSRICTNSHHEGDRFTATLANAVQGTNGVLIPAGSVASFRITESTKKAGGKDSLNLAYEIVSVKVGDDVYEVTAHMTESTPLQYVNIQSNTDKATKIGAGAVIGAIAGRIIGGGTKGTVIGTVAGAAAGAAVANNTRDYIACISETSSLALALDRPLTIRLVPRTP